MSNRTFPREKKQRPKRSRPAGSRSIKIDGQTWLWKASRYSGLQLWNEKLEMVSPGPHDYGTYTPSVVRTIIEENIMGKKVGYDVYPYMSKTLPKIGKLYKVRYESLWIKKYMSPVLVCSVEISENNKKLTIKYLFEKKLLSKTYDYPSMHYRDHFILLGN